MDSNHWPSGYEPDELPNCSTPPENELHCIIKKNKKEKQESKKSRLPFFFLLCCIYPLRMTNKETSWKERKTNVVLSTNVNEKVDFPFVPSFWFSFWIKIKPINNTLFQRRNCVPKLSDSFIFYLKIQFIFWLVFLKKQNLTLIQKEW